jgi:hypothetical protein
MTSYISVNPISSKRFKSQGEPGWTGISMEVTTQLVAISTFLKPGKPKTRS